MIWKAIGSILFFLCWQGLLFASSDLATLKQNQRLADFQVAHLYSDASGAIVGAKFIHISTGAPIFLLQVETVPQLFTWVDCPANSSRGLGHALEHLLTAKGVKARYLNLLKSMRLSVGGAETLRDEVYYGLSSGSGVDGFFEQFHALLDALYRPDFLDIEAEREFYHFAATNDKGAKKTLVESGPVYNEMLSSQYRYDYIYELNRKILGDQNPLSFNSGGAPDEMRTVMPAEIRRFHDKYYQLGPGTGFIFSFPPREPVRVLLQRISAEFRQFGPRVALAQPAIGVPKYPIQPSTKLEPGIYPFPGPNEAGPGFVHFSWVPTRSDGLMDLKLLELFFHALAEGQDSLLHKAIVDSKTRTYDWGATGVDYEISVDNSPLFPIVVLEVAGMPGNRISIQSLEQLRAVVVSKIQEVAQYSDQSMALMEFNESVASYIKSVRRSDKVWIKNPPGFGSYPPDNAWKQRLLTLESDPGFVRSLSEEQVWQAVDQQLLSGKNLWRNLIQRLRLSETPYVTATAPSPKLLGEVEKRRKERIENKIDDLMVQYHTGDDQEAISRFEQEELTKTKVIDEIDAKVPRPRFTEHPPLTPDEDLRYSRFQIEGVPVIASTFNRPPTIDIGVSFDLRNVPERFYKYLPLLPKSLDSIGLKKGGHVVSYSDLFKKIQEDVFALSTGYEFNPVSKRADLTIRASAVDVKEFRRALGLIGELMQFNYLDPSNEERLRDIVTQRIAVDNLYFKQDASTTNSAFTFRYQSDRLILVLNSRFTDVHLNARLRWLLHPSVQSAEIDKLADFARGVLSSTAGMPRDDLRQKLAAMNADGLQKELVDYWISNLSSFPETELASGLGQLLAEALEDLRTGPVKTVEDLRELQKIVLNRNALRIDLTLSQGLLGEIRTSLAGFVASIPARSFEKEENSGRSRSQSGPMLARLQKRYQLSQEGAPWKVGFVNSNRTGGDVQFYADFPSYSQIDRQSLIRVLASYLLAGVGPESLQIKTLARGLTYHNSIYSNPAVERIWYYADRSPDVPSLINFVNEIAPAVSGLRDPAFVDYAYSNSFASFRAMSSFSERGKAAAQDIRDGLEPENVRRFSEAILSLRKDPNLLSELTEAGFKAICGVLLLDDCSEQHRSENSLFFFVGSEQVLSDVEKRLSIPNFRKLYPSDFWIDF